MAASGQPATTSQPGPDWTVQVADTIDSVVAAVRDKSAVPLETIARGLVYGIILAVMGITALVLVVIAAVRLLAVPLPVWAAYVILGAIFTIAGLLLWSKRRPTGRR